MNDSTPTQLRFPAVAGFTVRADFNGGALSSDFGALLMQGVDRQTVLIDRLASAIEDTRHPSYIDHSLADLQGTVDNSFFTVLRRECTSQTRRTNQMLFVLLMSWG